jgi:hypothetical protein
MEKSLDPEWPDMFSSGNQSEEMAEVWSDCSSVEVVKEYRISL